MIMVEGCYLSWEGASVSNFGWRGRCGVWGVGEFSWDRFPTSQLTNVLESLAAVYPRAPTLVLPQRGPFVSALLRSGWAVRLLVWPSH